MGTIETVWVKMHDLYETSLNAIKASFEKSVYVVQHRYKSPIFQFLRGMVSIVALEKMLEEMKNVGEYGVDPLLCGCMLRSRCGLPCAHEIDDHLRELKPISIDKVDKFWRKLDMNPLEGFEIDVKTNIMNRWKEMLHVVDQKFEHSNESEMLLMFKRLTEIANPSTTSLLEPEVQIKTRGRPKNTKSKAATSTKREKSAFEYTDSVNDGCSPINEEFAFETHQTSNPMFTTKKAEKQKVCLMN